MANEIYDSTWWGNTIQTASSIGTSTEMIQGQFNLTKLGDEEVTNGGFDTDSDWNKGSRWSIGNGVATKQDGATSNLSQVIDGISGKTLQVSYEVSNYSGGNVGASADGSNYNANSGNGVFTDYITPTSNNLYIRGSYSFGGSIDNVSVKESRAEEVEAVKCLADAIHRIGIQDIQN
jgi:hypothetical protein